MSSVFSSCHESSTPIESRVALIISQQRGTLDVDVDVMPNAHSRQEKYRSIDRPVQVIFKDVKLSDVKDHLPLIFVQIALGPVAARVPRVRFLVEQNFPIFNVVEGRLGLKNPK